MAKYTTQFRVTPTVQASAYSGNKMLCAPIVISGVAVSPSMAVQVKSITAISLGAFGDRIDYLFFRGTPAITNGINQDCNISTANLQATGQFIETAAATSFTPGSLGGGTTVAMSTIHPNNLVLQADALGNITMVVIHKGTTAPSSTSAFTFIVDFEQL